MTRTVTVGLRAVNSQFNGEYKKSALVVRELGTEAKKSEKKLLQLNESMHLAGGASLNLRSLPPALKAGAAAGVAVGTALGYSAKKAIDFDKSMRNVNSISHLTDAVLGGLEDQILSLSKTLPQSANTLAEGLYDIASSGFQGADGMKVLQASAISASAGMTETSVAAQAITAVLNAYGQSATAAADVSDTLFQTVNLGVTNFESLAHNVGDYIGQAHALGLSFAQTQSAIATLTLTGTTQMQAGTALGAVLNGLIRPSTGLSAALKQMGYDSGQAALQSLGLRGTLMALSKATGGSTSAMGELFVDSQALRSVFQLTSGDGKKWADVATQIEDPVKRAGAAQKAMAEQAKSLAFQMGVAKNKVDAAAISVGRHLLPLLAQGMDGAFAFGDKVAAQLEPLLPAFKDLADAVAHLGHLAGELAGDLAPVAESLGKLAAVPVVVLFEALAKALELVTGLAEDHEQIVLTLAIAYGITLYGGVARVAYVVGVELVVALSKALFSMDAMIAKAGSAKAALTGMASSSTAVTLVFTAALVAGISAWSGYSDGAHETAEALKKVNEALSKPGDITGFSKARDEIAKTRDDLTAFAKEQQDKPLLESIFNFKGNAKTVAIGQHLKDIQEQAHVTDKAFEAFQNHVTSYFESKLHGQAADDFHNEMVLTGKAFDEAVPTLEAAGVKVTDTYDTIAQKLNDYRAQTSGAAGASKQVTTAMEGIAVGASSAEDSVTKLKDSLDALMGVFLSSDEAAIAFEKSLDDMQATLKKNGRTLDISTDKGRENKSAIIDGVKALEQKIEADAAAGQSAEQLATSLTTGRDRLIAQATAAGMSKAAMEKLLATYNLTPALVKTVIAAVGTPKATQDVQALKAAIDELRSKQITIDIATHQTSLRAAETQLGIPHKADGGAVFGAGTGTSDSILAMLSNGEFVVNAAQTRKHLALLQAINGDKMPRFATGGHVSTSYNPKGGSVSHQTARIRSQGGTIDDVNALMASWDAYLAHLDQVKQRAALVSAYVHATTAADKAQARKDLADFDAQARIDSERAAVDKLTASMQKAADVENHRREIMDNRYKLGLVSAKDEAADLDKRMAKVEKYSDEWMQLNDQKQQVLADGRQKQLDTVSIVDPAAYPARASGGRVYAGDTYGVGEHGRELFTAQSDGYLLNARMTQLLTGGGGARIGGGHVDKSVKVDKVVMVGTKATPQELVRELGWWRR